MPKAALGDSIDWTGFGTDFEEPLNDAYVIATETADRFDKVLLYFLSDGSSAYPATALAKFLNNDRLKAKLRFEAVGFGDTKFPVLKDMANAFEKVGVSGKMTNARTHEDLTSGFTSISASFFGDDTGSGNSASSNPVAAQPARMDCRPDSCGIR